jgi:uridine phosphorylase
LTFALTAFSRWVATKFSKQCLQNEWKHDNVRGWVMVSVQMEHSNSVSICLTGAGSGAVAILLCALMTTFVSWFCLYTVAKCESIYWYFTKKRLFNAHARH